jgi:PAS domain S-box-containing protein
VAADLSRAIEAAPVGMLVSDAAGRCSFANRAARRLTGLAEADVATSWFAAVDPEHRPVVQEATLAAMALEDQQSVVFRVVRPPGAIERWLEATVAPLPRPAGGDGRPECVVTLVDLTAARRLERELRRSNEELRQFTSIASHDLKSPLAVAHGFMLLLKRQLGDDAKPELLMLLDKSLDAVDRLVGLINDLLAFSQAGSAELRMERLDLGQLAAEAVEAVQSDHDESAVIDVGELPVVFGDGRLLRQVFQNLLANALKYVSPGTTPRVTVRSDWDGEMWRITVEDNGIGVAPDQRQRIFGMFERLHGSDTYRGTGVGLAICDKAVRRHGGTIWVDDAPGGGSRFCFTLPQRSEPEEADARPLP